MAQQRYYIDGRYLYYDNGSGEFVNKGNADATSNQALKNGAVEVSKPVGEASTSSSSTASSSSSATSTEKISINITPTTTAGNTLRYPSDPGIIESDSDYVLFSFYNYAPPFGSNVQTAPSGATATSSASGVNVVNSYENYASSSDRSYSNPATDVKPIVLYMPEDIQSQFGAGWNGVGFGAAAAGLLNLSGAVGSGKDIIQQLQAGGESVLGGLKAATFNEITKAINSMAGATITPNQALAAVTGTIINPNVEMLYEAPKLRTFNLRFKMSPRSSSEAQQIQKICNTFKKAMLPSFGGQALFGTTEAGNFITMPYLCQVNFMSGSEQHPYLPKYKLCGITDVNINYTADGTYSTFSADKSPVATELTISFLESKIVFSNEVEEGGGGI